ncbi:MAG: hypothetical protein K9N49_06355 [Candidatus Marinimicrobia bacterium]|nr:hypothetical protein [Candidatus Neomarinimicrobiota bacterium]
MKSNILTAGGPLRFQGSRWEFEPGYLEVCAGPWGPKHAFGADVVGSWLAAIDWHADHGLNVMVANIPYAQTDPIYLGWGFHYLLDFAGYPHAEDLFSADFRQRNMEALNRIFSYGRERGVLMLVHHFNYFAPRRMAVAQGWVPRYPGDEADWTDGPAELVSVMRLLTHNCCWNHAGYREFMLRCWRDTMDCLPDLGGFLVTPGEGNHGLFEEPGLPVPPGKQAAGDPAYRAHLPHWYQNDRRYVETSADFIRTFDETIRAAGRFPLVRAWSVEGAPHRMPVGPTYLMKHQLFDCIDAPGDELIGRWLKQGHTLWVEAMFIGENAGPIQWAGLQHFQRIGKDIRGSGVQGALCEHKRGHLDYPSRTINFEAFHAAVQDPARLDDRTAWAARLAPSFGAQADRMLEAMELTGRGVLLMSKVCHRLGEGWGFGGWPTLTPPLQGIVNLGHTNGTPPPWCRGNLVTLKEYLDYLDVNPWHENWQDAVRGHRACPLAALDHAAADAARAEDILDAAQPSVAPEHLLEWRELRCSAALSRLQAAGLAEMCRVKVFMAAVRACALPEKQVELARAALAAVTAAERALAEFREWLIQYPDTHGLGVVLARAAGQAYRTTIRQLQPYRRELQRFLDGDAWTLSRYELMWRAMLLDGPASQPHLAGDGVPLAAYRTTWPATRETNAQPPA